MLQFLVISRKTYQIALGVLAAIAVIVLAVFLIGLLATQGSPAPKGPRRADGLQQERVLVAADARFDGMANKALRTRHSP